jgi:glutaminyl-tRNA synthetase
MPTICGFRRRGYTPRAIHNFIDRIGYTKYDGIVDVALLEHAVREDLNLTAPRVSAVLRPLKLILTNYPAGKVEAIETVNNPEDPDAGTHRITFSGELYIERDDFMEDAPKNFYRLSPGKEVRLRGAYIVRCTGLKKNPAGEIEEIYAEYDPDTKSGMPDSNRKVKATLHWVSVAHSLPAEVRLYDRLFLAENPAEEKDKSLREMINPHALTVLTGCRVEAFLQEARPFDHFQFCRTGYFNVDPDIRSGHLVFNRTVSLKDNWSKLKDKP